MKEIIVKVYQYSELNEKAKEKARDWFLDGSSFDWEWDSLKEDAKTIGLELVEWKYGCYLKAEWINAPYSVIEKIKKEHGEKCETHKTALEYEASFKALGLDEDGQQGEDENLEQDFLNALAEDYRVLADRQYEYTQSEEYIAETMEANEYTFLESGKRF
jgi:hypothetical protein